MAEPFLGSRLCVRRCLEQLDKVCDTPGTTIPFLYTRSSEKLMTCPRFHSCFWKSWDSNLLIFLIPKHTIFFPHPDMGTDFPPWAQSPPPLQNPIPSSHYCSYVALSIGRKANFCLFFPPSAPPYNPTIPS